MSKPRIIQIEIPKPCSQNLDEMAATDNGRFCTHCQKNVIDFSTWSDTALYNFFSKNKDHVCGRFLATQLERPIQIPYQPHSKLYRIAIALGLTLVFTQTPHALAQNRPPKTEQSSILKQAEPAGNQLGEIHGKVLDEDRNPVMNVVINVSSGSIKNTSITDSDGNYTVKSLYPGYYNVQAIYRGYKELIFTGTITAPGQTTTLNIVLQRKQVNDTAIAIMPYRKPLVDGSVSINSQIINDTTIQVTGELRTTIYSKPLLDLDNPTKRTFTRDEINNTPK